MKKVYIASDHAGIELKAKIIKLYDCEDLGPFDDKSVDYPDYAHELCRKIDQNSVGILICGSGIGMSIVANRHPHIRAALCHIAEVAKLARRHNDANVIVLGARVIPHESSIQFVKDFFDTEFEGGRHIGRIQKINLTNG